jgi:peptide-methionine (S)-S-oxide reductase
MNNLMRLLMLPVLMLVQSCSGQTNENKVQQVFAEKSNDMDTTGKQVETATLGGGCFWCVEAVYLQLEGVQSVMPGYSGGARPNPTYEQVCSGATGHAEVIQIVFDPAVVTFDEILEVFFTVHDPTQLNRQGNDVGTQYRSVIFYHDEKQKEKAEYYITKLNESGAYSKPVVTEVAALKAFYPAEDYHKNYYARNSGEPYCTFVVQPKVEKFQKVFKDKLKR